MRDIGHGMNKAGRLSSFSDEKLSRLIRGGLAVLVVGIALLGAVIVLGRGEDHGPTLVERQVTAAEQDVRKAPNEIGPRLMLAQAYVAAGREVDALRQYDQVLKVSPGHKAALLGRGDIMLDRGDLEEAAKVFGKVTDTASGGQYSGVDPQLEHAYYGLGSVALTQNRPKDAVIALERAAAINGADADVWYLLGTAALKAGDARRSVDALRRTVLFVPTGWCEPYDTLSQAYAALGKKASAEYAAAMVDFCKDDADRAVKRLEALTAGPAKLDAMLGLGMIAEARTQRAAAIAWYRKVLAADPENFNARAGLSRMGASAAAPHKTNGRS